MEKSQKAIIQKALYWVFLIFLVYLIYEIVRKMLGGSLGFEELVIGLLIANLGYSFYLMGSINSIDRKISSHISWHKGKDLRE